MFQCLVISRLSIFPPHVLRAQYAIGSVSSRCMVMQSLYAAHILSNCEETGFSLFMFKPNVWSAILYISSNVSYHQVLQMFNLELMLGRFLVQKERSRVKLRH